MKSLRIVFMGTAEFAVATLGSLLMNGFNVVGVVTAPDRPSGRGRKISKSPVKEFAEFSYLPIMQPENLKDPVFIDSLKKLNADVFIVVAFRMLPEAVWRIPVINCRPSPSGSSPSKSSCGVPKNSPPWARWRQCWPTRSGIPSAALRALHSI